MKTYILDTSVLIHSPASILAFEENEVVIPRSAIEDLGELQKRGGEIGQNARECNHILDTLCERGNLSAGVKTDAGGIVRIAGTASEEDQAISLCKRFGGILVTQDENKRVSANSSFVVAERYKHDLINVSVADYTGRATVYIPEADFVSYSQGNTVDIQKVISILDLHEDGSETGGKELFPNECLIIKNASNPTSTLLGIVKLMPDKSMVIRHLRYNGSPVMGIKPLNVGQRFALEALLAPCDEIPLVFLKGSAGTAKTLLSITAGLCQSEFFGKDKDSGNINQCTYDTVLVTRSAQNYGGGEDIGYLKGDEFEKILPLIRPVLDNASVLLNSRRGEFCKDGIKLDPVKELFDRKVVTAQAMAFMRGRSLNNHFTIIDECQNLSIGQAKMILTRTGHGTKTCCTGDINQIDSPYLDKFNNGLTFASQRMKGSPLCFQITFTDDECSRSPLAAEAIKRLTRN